MKKYIRLIAIFFSISWLLVGCNGKNIDSPENVITDPIISENEISDNEDDEINNEDDVEIPVDNIADTSLDESDDAEIETDTNSDLDDSSDEIDPELASYIDFNYDEADTKGLSKETIDLFAPCAIYLANGSNTDNEDLLSSKEWDDISEFLFYWISSENKNVEFVHDYDMEKDIYTKQWRIQYEEWEYLLREVLKEKDPQKVRDMLGTEFGGEMGVFYNPDDDYIYKEVGTIGWGYEEAKVREVKREGDAYIITYDLWSGFTKFAAPYSVVEVVIAESDNKYGYSLVSIDVIKEFDVWY